MRLKPILLGSTILVFVALLVYLSTLHETLRKSGTREPGAANVLRLTTAHIQKHEDDILVWEVWAEKAIYMEDGLETLLTGVRFKIYNQRQEDGTPVTISGTAGRAQINEGGETLVLNENVHVSDTEDTEVRGERLVYHHADGLLTSSDPVWLRKRDTFHQGSRMHYLIREQRLTLGNPKVYQ